MQLRFEEERKSLERHHESRRLTLITFMITTVLSLLALVLTIALAS